MSNLFFYSAVIICGFALIYLFNFLLLKGWKKEKGGLVEQELKYYFWDIYIPSKYLFAENWFEFRRKCCWLQNVNNNIFIDYSDKINFISNHLSPCPAHYQTRMCVLTKLICDYTENYKLIIKSPKDYEKIFNEVNNLEQLKLYLDGKGNKEKVVSEVYEYFEGLR